MSNIVKLNVGGTRYETTTTTLTRFGDSMLARLIQQPNEMEKISQGNEIFIDRDGANFGYMLNYLRDGDDMIIPEDKAIRERLIGDAGFYQLPGLVGLIKAASALKVGDVVQLANGDVARAYFDSIMSKEKERSEFDVYNEYDDEHPETTYMCWVCQGTSKFYHSSVYEFKKCRGKIPLKYEFFVGKVFGIEGQCAKIRVAKGCLAAIFSEVLGGDYDNAIEIHMPLAYLKLATQ